MKVYLINGTKRWYDEKKAPSGAICLSDMPKAAPKAEASDAPSEIAPETKARRKPRNKSRKAGENK